MVVALVGGLWPALAAAVVGSLLLNYYFTPPIHTFTIAEHENVLALAVFLAVAVAVSVTVDRAARRTREAAAPAPRPRPCPPSRAACCAVNRPLPALLDQLRETFGFAGVTLLERRPDAAAGTGAAARPRRVAGRRQPSGDRRA